MQATSGRHCLFFEADQSRILVVRVLHDRMDYRRHLEGKQLAKAFACAVLVDRAERVRRAPRLPRSSRSSRSSTISVADQLSTSHVKVVQEAKKSGKTVEDVVTTWKISERYVGYALTCLKVCNPDEQPCAALRAYGHTSRDRHPHCRGAGIATETFKGRNANPLCVSARSDRVADLGIAGPEITREARPLRAHPGVGTDAWTHDVQLARALAAVFEGVAGGVGRIEVDVTVKRAALASADAVRC
jgi:hypothetical protein